MSEIRFSDYEKPTENYNEIIYPESLLDKKCGGCVRCELRKHPYKGKSGGYHCCIQSYDTDIFPMDKACVHYWDKENHERIKQLQAEAEENRRKELWAAYSGREPVKLPIINDGYGMIPECPVCGEMPYSTEQCHWCGQKFIQDDDIKEYAKSVKKKMKCINCGADVIADVSKYNGHIRYSCAKCGASVMS